MSDALAVNALSGLNVERCQSTPYWVRRIQEGVLHRLRNQGLQFPAMVTCFESPRNLKSLANYSGLPWRARLVLKEVACVFLKGVNGVVVAGVWLRSGGHQ